jgi:hypothetical protein
MSLAVIALIAGASLHGPQIGRPSSADAGDATPPAGQLIASPEPDWPQWRGPRRDGICGPQDLQTAWPEDGPPWVWKIDGLGAGWSSPIVVGPGSFRCCARSRCPI